MSRRRKKSPADDLVELVAMLPWWVGVGLGVAVYFALHHIADQQVAAPNKLDQLGVTVTQTLWKTLAQLAQYLLPAICFLGSAMSARRRFERRALTAAVRDTTATDALDDMSWRQFEMLVGEAFRHQGYQVLETGGGGPDGGVDLALRKDGETFLVQCKHWKTFKVGVGVVREHYGVMAATNAAGGFVVTSGRFTADAVSFASGKSMNLIDGPLLRQLIRETRNPPWRSLQLRDEKRSGSTGLLDGPKTPRCPQCDQPMLTRTAKRGVRAGSTFWGCSDYPACRGIRDIVEPVCD